MSTFKKHYYFVELDKTWNEFNKNVLNRLYKYSRYTKFGRNTFKGTMFYLNLQELNENVVPF